MLNEEEASKYLTSIQDDLNSEFYKIGKKPPELVCLGYLIKNANEEVLQEIEELQDERIYAPQYSNQPIAVATSSQAFGLWRRYIWRSPRSVWRLHNVVEFKSGDGCISIRLADNNVFALYFPVADERHRIEAHFRQVRRQVVCARASAALASAFEELDAGNIGASHAFLSDACRDEHFNPLPQLLLHLAMMRVGKADGAFAALERVWELGADTPHEALMFTLNLEMSAARRYRLLEIALKRENLEDLSPMASALLALFEYKGGNPDGAVQHLLPFAQSVSRSNTAALTFIQTLRERLGDTSDDVRALWEQLVQRCEDLTVHDRHPPRPKVARPPFESLSDPDHAQAAAMALISEANDRFDATASVGAAWHLLRNGKVHEALGVFPDGPRALLTILNGTKQAGDPVAWKMALIVAELAAREALSHSAADIAADMSSALERVSRSWATTDPLVRHAADLRDFYAALALRDVDRARAYVAHFSEIPDLTWSSALAREILPQLDAPPPQVHDVSSAVFDRFDAWAANALKHTARFDDGKSAEVVERFRSLRKTDELRVVFAGEFGAGKSSLINALLGLNVLATDRDEATAAPIFIRRSDTWRIRATGHDGAFLIDRTMDDSLDETRIANVRTAVARHGFLKSGADETASEIELAGPFRELPDGIVYVDLPGFNASEDRGRLAANAFETAHACVFVIDARNALKRKEIKELRWISKAVGRTLFVLNKVDLIMEDDELNIDIDLSGKGDSITATLERIETELTREFGSRPIAPIAVSSLYATTGRESTLTHGAEPISMLRQRIEVVLDGSRERLIAFAAARAAKIVSETALRDLRSRVEIQNKRVALLVQAELEDPETFRQYLLPRAIHNYQFLLDQYVELMNKEHAAATEVFCKDVIDCLSQCNSKQQLQYMVEAITPEIFENYIRNVDHIRNSIWALMGDALMKDITNFFSAIYRDIDFQNELDEKRLLRLATQIPLGDITPMLRTSSNTAAASGLTVSKVVATGVIGWGLYALLGPIGGLIALASALMQSDPRFEVRDRIGLQFDQIRSIVSLALLVDLAPKQKRPNVPTEPLFRQLDSLSSDEKSAHSQRLGGEGFDSARMARALNADNILSVRDAQRLTKGLSSATDDLPPLVKAIAENIEAERRRFSDLVRTELDQRRQERQAAELDLEALRALATEAATWRWRMGTPAQ